MSMFRATNIRDALINDASKGPVKIGINTPIACLQECVGDAGKSRTARRFRRAHAKPDEKPGD